MLPVSINQAWPDPPIEVGTMAGHAYLGVNLLPTLQVASIGKESEKQAYEKD
jgi:hypothetical protein